MAKTVKNDLFDTSDIDRWIGVPIGGGEIIEDIHINDIRRWSQAMQNPNPLHFDKDWAAASRFGRIIAPQSFTVNCTWGHGAEPAIQGVVPGTHMLFGGDEWWFFGPRVAPGDVIRNDKMLFDYSVRDTAFAGPTIFSRGDTSYFNQRGELIAKQRSTSIRYLAEEAQKRVKEEDKIEPEWSDDDLARVEEEKMDYYKSFRDLGHDKRLFVRKGDKLVRRVIGPHTTQTFTSEWRAYLFTIWGASNYDMASSSTERAGWLPEMTKDFEGGKVDPSRTDGLYTGPSRGHTIPKYAQLIGMPRGYGYGASMGAWFLDYVANWAGEWGFVRHSDMRYRGPALTGDVTYLDGEVTEVNHDDPDALIARVQVSMTSHRGARLADGYAEVAVPRE